MLKDTVLIILNYKRISNVYYLVEKFKDKLPIYIINNNPSYKLHQIKGAGVINKEKNGWCIERWKFAKELDYKYAIILDDDINPSFHCIMRLITEIRQTPDRLISIYGRSGINKVSKYEDLSSEWCVDTESDIAVGACLSVSIPHLKTIWKDYLEPWGTKDRGDDIQVSLSMSDYYKTRPKIIKTEVSLLEEGEVGLNKHPDHFSKRWKVIQDFRSPFLASEN